METGGCGRRLPRHLETNMNLRVDLILESEQRSASLINLKALARIATVALPVLLVVLVLSSFWDMKKVLGELEMLQAQHDEIKPKQIEATELDEQFQVNRRTLEELQAWNHSRVLWHEQLLAFMREVPRTMQMQRFRVSEALHLLEDNVPARVYTLSIEGKAIGEDAETNVQLLKRRLQQDPPLGDLTEEVKVSRFAQDPAKDAGRNDRIFRIESSFVPRELK